MRNLRGLLVDNDPGNNQVIEESLDLAFGVFGWKVDWSSHTGAARARRSLRESDPFDFAIIDLYLASSEPNGLSIVPDLHDKQADTFVLVVTSFPELDHNFRDRARRSGAVAAVVRHDLLAESTEWSFPALASKIREHLVSRGLITLGHFSYDRENSQIASMLERLGGQEGGEDQRVRNGERILHNLAMRCLERPRIDEGNFRLSYLTPGRSGAQVCRVDLSMLGEPTESFVLKFGLDREALEREYRKNLEAARILTPQALVTATGVRSDSSGYCAIAARVAEGADTLGGWLQSADPAAARDVADILFGEHLRSLFRPELRSRCVLRDWVQPSVQECGRSRLVLDIYRDVVGHHDAGNFEHADGLLADLLAYIGDRQLPVGHPERLESDAVFVKSFGDLHSSNVLVQTGVHARPVLIDASLFGSAHWATDCARLLVDLMVRVRDPGVPSMLWGGVKLAVSATRALCPCYPGRYPDSQTAVDAFVLRVIDRLPAFLYVEELQLVKDQWHWQWHVALAREFFRQATLRDMTPPRTVLALVSAAIHLRYGVRLLDDLKYT
jgi:hypothetical protein